MGFLSDKSIYDREKVYSLDSLGEKEFYFLTWCSKHDKECDVGEIKKIIDKISIWYELRYPDSYFDQENIDCVMFGDNKSCNNLSWSEFYNFEKFYYSLSKDEKRLLDKPIFVDMIYLNSGRNHIHLYDDGTISDASDVLLFDRLKKDGRYIYDASGLLDGKTLDEWPNIMRDNKIKADYNKINNIINNYKKRISIYEGMFDTVMYNLIERGGKYYGPRRGVLFAREFDRDIKVPVSYGDSYLLLEYLANDGDGELACYTDYFDGYAIKKTVNEILNSQNLVGVSSKQKKKVFPKSCE